MSEYTYEEKESFDGKKVKVLGPTYEEGKPEGKADWEEKLGINRGSAQLPEDGPQILVQQRLVR